MQNLYTNKGATVQTEHGETDWLQTGKEVAQGGIHPHIFQPIS